MKENRFGLTATKWRKKRKVLLTRAKNSSLRSTKMIITLSNEITIHILIAQ